MAHFRDALLASAVALILTAVSASAASTITAGAPNGGNTYYGETDPDTTLVADNVDFTTDAASDVDYIRVSGTVWDSNNNPAQCTAPVRTKTDHNGCTAYAPNGTLKSAAGTHSITDPVYGNWTGNTNV